MKLCRKTYTLIVPKVTNHGDLQFQRRRFLKFQPIRNKNCLWQHVYCQF